jgi:hypothetical protein
VNPKLHPQSAAIIQKLAEKYTNATPGKLRWGDQETKDDWMHPIYYSHKSDPLYKVHCKKSSTWGKCDLEGKKIHIPAQARAAQGGDGGMTVIDLDKGWEHDFWRAKKPQNGVMRASFNGSVRVGTKDANGLLSSTTASHISNLAGIVRVQELQAGKINHALFMTMPCTSGNHVYPALGDGRVCPASNRHDAPSLGMRFQLNMSEQEIAALNAPQWMKAIYTALSKYGAYVAESGYHRHWGIHFESDASYTSFGKPPALAVWGSQQPGAKIDGPLKGRLDFAPGIDWAHRLRIIHPCVAQGKC